MNECKNAWKRRKGRKMLPQGGSSGDGHVSSCHENYSLYMTNWVGPAHREYKISEIQNRSASYSMLPR